MFLALELIFATLLIVGLWAMFVGTRRYNLSSRGMAISFAITALGWLGFLITTIALIVFMSTQVV